MSESPPSTAGPLTLRGLLSQSVEQTLELMCFAEALVREEAPPLTADAITARLGVSGDFEGDFWLSATRDAACRLSATLLAEGEASVDEGQSGKVVCELANIVCGSMLTRMSPGASFTLSEPALRDPALRERPTVELAFEVEQGLLWCCLSVTYC